MSSASDAFLLAQWTAPCRVYHNLRNHLMPMLQAIRSCDLPPHEDEVMRLAAWWHDAIYVPGAHDNEVRSVSAMLHYGPKMDVELSGVVERIIRATIDHRPTGDRLTDTFLKIDLGALHAGGRDALLWNDDLIVREFLYDHPQTEIDVGRRKFLTRMLEHPFVDHEAVQWLLDERYPVAEEATP